LIPGSFDATSKVFYLKMKGDYFRYISEYKHDSSKEEIIQKALQSYEQATKIST